jgi:hypothetical protein
VSPDGGFVRTGEPVTLRGDGAALAAGRWRGGGPTVVPLHAGVGDRLACGSYRVLEGTAHLPGLERSSAVSGLVREAIGVP